MEIYNKSRSKFSEKKSSIMDGQTYACHIFWEPSSTHHILIEFLVLII